MRAASRSAGDPAPADLELSIIIPAYRERHKIGLDIAAADDFLRSRHIDGEIIVVDDGSPDGTADVARGMQARCSGLRVVSYAKNRGKGHALAQGVLRARGAIVMFADAGLCVPYDVATLGIAILKLDMCDIAHGSRRMRGSVLRPQPLHRRIGSTVFGWIVHTLMMVPLYISDTQCGFKLYKRDAAIVLYGELATDGFMFDLEIILRALRRRLRILEFPVLWSNDADTRFSPTLGSPRLLRELVHIKWLMAVERRKGTVHGHDQPGLREDATVT